MTLLEKNREICYNMFITIIKDNKMYFFFALILFLPILALKPRTDGDACILDQKSTTCIKGILCIYVMLHNLGLDLQNGPIKHIVCENSGGVGVGLFFFLSAFGIVRAYLARGNQYLKNLLFVHIPKIWVVAVFINAITYFKFMPGEFAPLDMWLRILNLDLFNGLNRINRHGWYIATIIAVYIIFAAVYFICSQLKTKKKFFIAACIMAFIVIGFRLAAIIADYGRMYTREIPAFAIGCFYATFYDKINAFANKNFKLGLIISVSVFALSFLLCEPIATYAAACIVIFVSQKYTYYNKVTYFFGKISLGVYLFLHYSSMTLIFFIFQNEYLWVLLNAGFIIEAATMIYATQFSIDYSVRYIKNRILKKLGRADVNTVNTPN